MRRSNAPLRFALALLLAIAFGLGIFYLLMQPRQLDFWLMALVLSTTSVISLAVGYVAYRKDWISQAPSIRWSMLIPYLVSNTLIFLSVWITVRLMFVSEHDLLLATTLLLFAGGIALAMGLFTSEALAERIGNLAQAVDALRHRGFSARAQVSGQDEVAELAMTFNDMVERLQSAEERRQELEQARRDLIAWVSHDLQTPLASIRAMVEALADDMVDDQETVRRYLRTAQREVQSLSSLIDDLFEMAQLDAGGMHLELQRNSMADLVSDTVESFSAMAVEKGVRLSGAVEKDVDPVIMDARRVGRVLRNLVSNALRHTPPDGEVSISARSVVDGVEVEVKDTGEGVPPQNLPRIFDRFYRGEKSRSRATGGAGLGLAIAKGFIEAHGGAITAEPAAGGGTRFVFTLPLSPR